MYSLKAGVTPQDVVPRLFDHHPVNRENVKSDLNQDVLERSEKRAEMIGRIPASILITVKQTALWEAFHLFMTFYRLND